MSLASVEQRLNDHLESCEKASKEMLDEMRSFRSDIAAIKAMPMKAALWLLGVIIPAVIGLAAQNFVLHGETSKRADQAAAAATAASQAVQSIPAATARAVAKQEAAK